MKAETIIDLIKTLEPAEIERLFVLIKEYEAGVRRRLRSSRYVIGEEFEQVADKVFTENKELFRLLAELERNEQEASAQ